MLRGPLLEAGEGVEEAQIVVSVLLMRPLLVPVEDQGTDEHEQH